MRVKPEIAAVIMLAAVGVALTVGTLAGVVITRATAAEPERIRTCPCLPSTINT